MFTVRQLAFAALAGTLLAAVAFSPVRAAAPVRSGTILSGTGETPANPWVRGMEGCVGAPACSAWLQSGCAPALAGADLALHASIVDDADLADGVTERRLTVHRGVGLSGGPLTVQLWSRSDEWDMIDEPAGLDGQWCWELLADRLECRAFPNGCSLVIPADAEFMTITARPDGTSRTWTLTGGHR